VTEYGPRLPDPRMIPHWRPEHVQPPSAPEPVDGMSQLDGLADDMLVRPFLVTGGRTRPLREDLRVETMISALPAALSAPLRFELRRIVELCQAPLAIAELAVQLSMPLGVVRVLVADLVTDGYVACSEPAGLSISLLERIRDRVRAL
jgi:hypothetical protein